jgi:hypothetical protein
MIAQSAAENTGIYEVAILFGLWMFFVVLTVYAAERRNRRGWLWGIAAFFFGLFALITVLVAGKPDSHVETPA